MIESITDMDFSSGSEGTGTPADVGDSAAPISIHVSTNALPKSMTMMRPDSALSILPPAPSPPAKTAVEHGTSTVREPVPPSTTDAAAGPVPGPGTGRKWLSPLHMAAQKGHDRIVRMLLEHNGDCNEGDSEGLVRFTPTTGIFFSALFQDPKKKEEKGKKSHAIRSS